jgi:hypothetical protein
MKKILLSIFVLTLSFTVFAQHQADKWFFGANAGLNFSSGAPAVVVGGALNSPQGCSTISDASGNLLFYTEGTTVWNKTNSVMPNGSGLLGGTSSAQSALIVPMPGSTTQYYIFTTDQDGGPNGFRYSIVDMSLLSGSGNVTTKNVLILNHVTEKLTAVKDGSTNSYWIAVHQWGSNAFYSYRLTTAGLQPPVISNIGIVHDSSIIQNTYGEMKFSPCGSKLALAIGYKDTVEVFDFNEATGMVSNPITLSMGAHIYGVEFSQTSNYLYVSTYDPSATLLQYNMNAPNFAALLASRTPLSSTPSIYGLQLANDGKIYVVKDFSQYLGVIVFPDSAGLACHYIDNAVNLDPTSIGITSGLELPGFVQSYFLGNYTCPVSTGIQENTIDNVKPIYPNPSADQFVFELSDITHPVQITIYDYAGKLVEQYNTESSSIHYSFGKSYSSGMYFIVYKSGTDVRSFKIVKL